MANGNLMERIWQDFSLSIPQYIFKEMINTKNNLG